MCPLRRSAAVINTDMNGRVRLRVALMQFGYYQHRHEWDKGFTVL